MRRCRRSTTRSGVGSSNAELRFVRSVLDRVKARKPPPTAPRDRSREQPRRGIVIDAMAVRRPQRQRGILVRVRPHLPWLGAALEMNANLRARCRCARDAARHIAVSPGEDRAPEPNVRLLVKAPLLWVRRQTPVSEFGAPLLQNHNVPNCTPTSRRAAGRRTRFGLVDVLIRAAPKAPTHAE